MLKKILGSAFVVGGFIYEALNRFASAITLWPDLSAFWKEHMMGQPVIPYILMAVGLLVLAWVYFPAWGHFLTGSAKAVIPVQDDNPKINQSVNIGTMSGGNVSPTYNNHFNTIVAPGRAVLSEDGKASLANALYGTVVSVEIIGDIKSQTIGFALLDWLKTSGVVIGGVTMIGMKVPPPADPYTVSVGGDGQSAFLMISPATIP